MLFFLCFSFVLKYLFDSTGAVLYFAPILTSRHNKQLFLSAAVAGIQVDFGCSCSYCMSYLLSNVNTTASTALLV